MATDNFTNVAEEAYLAQVNRYQDCYIVNDEHHEAMKQFCGIMAEHGVLRLTFRINQEHHAKYFVEINLLKDLHEPPRKRATSR